MEDDGELLRTACLSGDVRTAHALLLKGVNADDADAEGWTPMMLACANGMPDVIELLLSVGANINTRMQDGGTALMAAAAAGLVRLLLLQKGSGRRRRGRAYRPAGASDTRTRREGRVELVTSIKAENQTPLLT